MLITELKEKDVILSAAKGKIFAIVCHGCKEIHFPEAEADEFLAELKNEGRLTGSVTTEYICNHENLQLWIEKYHDAIAEADTVLVLSCGVGVQTTASLLPGKRVIAGCDTYALPGFQGVTPLEHDCGQCGGSKNGMCEVDPTMECGWERIQRRLAQVGRLDVLKCPVQLRNYAVDETVTK